MEIRQYPLKVPVEMWARLEKVQAKRPHMRSINALLCDILDQGLAAYESSQAVELAQALERR